MLGLFADGDDAHLPQHAEVFETAGCGSPSARTRPDRQAALPRQQVNDLPPPRLGNGVKTSVVVDGLGMAGLYSVYGIVSNRPTSHFESWCTGIVGISQAFTPIVFSKTGHYRQQLHKIAPVLLESILCRSHCSPYACLGLHHPGPDAAKQDSVPRWCCSPGCWCS